MSSPQETVKLADEIRQRQAADRHFPTFATRGFGRRDRPSIQTDSTQAYGTSTDSAARRAASSVLEEDDGDHKDEASTSNVETQPVKLPDDDDEEAGELEMDYALPANAKQEDEVKDDESKEGRHREGGEGPSLAAEILAAAAEAGSSAQKKRTLKHRPDSLKRAESSSSAGRASVSSLDSQPTSPTPRRKRASLSGAESSRDSQFEAETKKRMTVVLEGEMPEGDQVRASSDMEEDEEANGHVPADKREVHEEDEVTTTTSRKPKDPTILTDNRATVFDKDGGEEMELDTDAADDESKDDEEEELEEEDDEEESEEEEDVEPSLKYSRVKGGVSDVLKKDTASAFALSSRFMALGTHAGMIYILDIDGNLVKGFRLHTASILDLVIDNTSDFVAAASMDGLVSISALATAEQYIFDFKRPMRCITLEPNFGRKSSRAFACGGMAGNLTHREKSWFGHKETVLHSGEGPIWTTRWRGNMIAWASNKGVRVYDTDAKQRISFISPPSKDVRGDLHRCTLYWQDDRTLLIAWADHIKVAKIKEKKSGGATASSAASIASNSTQNAASALSKVGVPGGSAHPQYFIEITAIFQLDCMISGIAPYGLDYLVLAYVTEEPESSDDDDDDDDMDDRSIRPFKRREALRPELRIISRAGEELSSDVLSLNDYARFQCNDYLLVPSVEAHAYSAALLAGRKVRTDITEASQFYVVSPRDIVLSKPRDEKDHVEWLLERQRFQEALVKIEAMGRTAALQNGFDAEEIGKKYLNWLVEEDRYQEAAKVASKILGRNVGAWEDWIFLFVEKGKLGLAIPFIPTSDPTLSEMIYDMILAHFLQHDRQKLLETIRDWPPEIYSTQAVVLAVEDRLKSGSGKAEEEKLLMECLAEIYIRNRQPGKALQYYLRLRRANVFDLIRENNLFTAVQDQALLLIEFEEDLKTRRSTITKPSPSKHGAAIDLLVDHTYSIPIGRVISQLESHPRYLYMYLDALFDRDAQQVTPFCDLQLKLYAEYEPARLMSYLRAMSSFYSFEKAYAICEEHDYVPEMVFLLGRVGDNKRALSLIIERLGDVERAIEFAKEQNDNDLWEDLLGYSESRPAFIRKLLENVGAEIDPIRLIRRIKNGLKIPGLKAALIKILSDFTLQISLLEGCERILSSDTKVLSDELQRSQSYGGYVDEESVCATCATPLFAKKTKRDTYSNARQPKVVFYLCGHVHHLTCLLAEANLPGVKAEATAVGEVKCTTTQAFAGIPSIRQRWSSVEQGTKDEAGVYRVGKQSLMGTTVEMAPYGPLQRYQESVAQFQARLKYESRLRSTAVAKKGCPTCRKEEGLTAGS